MAKERIKKEDMYNKLMGSGSDKPINKDDSNEAQTNRNKIIEGQLPMTQAKTLELKEAEKISLKKRGYYITDKHIKAITLKTAEDPSMDKSEVVRKALDLYLKDILEQI